MEKTFRLYNSPKEMKAEEYRYWRRRPVHERMAAVAELTLAAYQMKGMVPDAQRLRGPLVRLQRPWR
jgi:hypothetical protein